MNTTSIIIYSVLVAAAWFAPILFCGWAARHWLRKDGDKVIIAGLLFWILGSVIAAAVLPKLSDEEWEAKGKKQERWKSEREPMTQDTIMLAGLIVGCVIALGGIVALKMIG
jgi:MFS family permease